MNRFTRMIAMAAVAGAFSATANAVTVSSASVTMNVGGSATLTVSNLSGTLKITNSNPTVVTVTRTGTYTYRVDAPRFAGNATLTFKDSLNAANVAVSVSPVTPLYLNGRLLSSNCFQCHGTNGSGGFDKIAGKSASEIYGELREFASGKEDPNGIMAAHAKGFSDAQMLDIANYLSTLK